MENLYLIPAILLPISALLYIALIHKRPIKGDWAIKAMPALSLAALSLILIPGIHGYLLCAGFVLSACGDISLSFNGEKYFIGGLVSFLLAHVVYIVTYANGSPWSTEYWWMLVFLGIFGVVMLIVLTPKLGEMKIPVYVYMSVILTMDAMAVLNGSEGLLLIPGALIFTVSDSILALDKFNKPIRGAQYWIMSTYYVGQTLIFAGVWMQHCDWKLC
jgi:uncharacterized membrane protein YhhN